MVAERTVLASFHSRSEAQEAEKQVQGLGVDVTQVAEFGPFSGLPTERDSFLISGEIPSLASITLHNTPGSRDSGVLLAADPSASGMSDGQGNVTGRNFLLTAVCPESLVEQAVQVIKQCNGYT